MQRHRAFAILMAALAGLMAVSGVSSAQAPPSNTTRHTTKVDLVSQAGPLEIVQLTIDFVPGAASSIHYHSGVSHNTVLAGELTVRYADGGERRVGVGEGWTDEPGVVHQALNPGDKPATVVASFVQPRGAMVTIPVASFRSQNPTLPRALPNTGDGSCGDRAAECE